MTASSALPRRWLATLWLLLAATPALAQVSGRVALEHLGLSFEVPAGWAGQENGNGYLFGSETEPGLILVSRHAYPSVEALKAEMGAGFSDGNALYFEPESELEAIGGAAVGGRFSGHLEGQPAAAFLAGSVNPHGQGLLFMVVTSPEAWSARHRELALALAKSTRYSKPKPGSLIAQWKRLLSGHRLTHIESSYSPDYSGGFSGASRSRQVLDLCPSGAFTLGGSSSLSISGSGGSALGSDQVQGAGRWEVQVIGGQPALLLNFSDGRATQAALTMEDDKLYLNGSRYFRTQDPACP